MTNKHRVHTQTSLTMKVNHDPTQNLLHSEIVFLVLTEPLNLACILKAITSNLIWGLVVSFLKEL